MNNNIRMYRGKYKITQEELSIKLGVSRQTINSIENNKYFPSLELGLKLSKIFECKVDDLFSLDDPTT
jgi:putative transcriptional regulator